MASNRVFLNNVMFEPDVVYLPSSEEAQLPAEHLRDQLPQAIWQTQGPWVITEHNRRIDFNRGGVKVAEIALGTYATGALLAAAVVVALEAADALPQWACDYNSSSAFKFRIRDAGGAPLSFVMLWATGTNAYRSSGPDLGFSVADSASVTTTTSDTVSYQSRHFLVLHRSDASNISALAAILLQHNLSSTATARWEANSTNAWATPATSQSYSGAATDPWILTFSGGPIGQPYFRLTLSDVQNTDGFLYVGIIHLGDVDTPTVCCSESLSFTQQDMSQMAESISGAGFVSQEPDFEVFGLEYTDIPDGGSDETLLDELRGQPIGSNFFFQFVDTDAATLFYVCKIAGSRKQCVAGGLYWTYDIPLAERI